MGNIHDKIEISLSYYIQLQQIFHRKGKGGRNSTHYNIGTYACPNSEKWSRWILLMKKINNFAHIFGPSSIIEAIRLPTEKLIHPAL